MPFPFSNILEGTRHLFSVMKGKKPDESFAEINLNASGDQRVEVTNINPILTQLSGSNVELKAKTTITWDGIDTTNNVEVPVADRDVLLYIDNTADKELTVTLETEVEENVWVPYVAGDGTAISFKVAATTGKGVFGVFQKFPKFLGGRIVFTAAEEPTADGTTIVQVQEV